jgi:hypothetical protein
MCLVHRFFPKKLLAHGHPDPTQISHHFINQGLEPLRLFCQFPKPSPKIAAAPPFTSFILPLDFQNSHNVFGEVRDP